MRASLRTATILALVLVVAAFLRFCGLAWSLPDELHARDSYHGGESRAVAVALQLDVTQGELEPRWRGKPFLRWGSHWFYALHATNLVAAAVGFLDLPPVGGAPTDGDAARSERGLGPDEIDAPTYAAAHLVARGLSVVYSLATVLVVFVFAARAYGRRTALWAAVGVALCPLLAYQARFATVNSCLTFWCALALLLAARAAQHATLGAVFVAACAIGLGTAVKLAALPLAVPLAVAVLLATSRHPAGRRLGFALRGTLVGAAGCLAGFAVAMPYAFLRWTDFVEQARAELASNEEGHGLVFAGTGNGFAYLELVNLPVALGWPLWALSQAGLAALVFAVLSRARAGWRAPSPAFVADVLMLTWILVNVFVLGTASRRFLRYALPMTPFLVLTAARFAAGLGRPATEGAAAGTRPGAVRRVAEVAAALIALYTLFYTAASVRPFTRVDPRDACARWFHEHVPAGATVAFVKRPYNGTPPLYEAAAGPAGLPSDVPRYAISVLDADPERLEAQRPEWVVLNTDELFDELRLASLWARPELDVELAELGLEPELRAFVARAARFHERLAADYELAETWRNPAVLAGVSFDWPEPPQGWAGASPTLEAWRRR